MITAPPFAPLAAAKLPPCACTRDDLARSIFGSGGVDAATTGDLQAIACLDNPAQTGLEDDLPEWLLDPLSTPVETPEG